MTFFGFNLPARRLVRFLVAFCACALFLASLAFPVYAVTSKPGDGEANLTNIERKSIEATLSKPYDLEKTQGETNRGLNEVQGDADKDKMLNPQNTTARSFEDQVKDAMGSITNKDD